MLRRVTLWAVVAVLLAAIPAAAKQKPATGTLSKSGYTVVALADNGRLTSASGRKFRLVPPAKQFTLHLRTRNGSYAGPVVAPTGRRTSVITGFRAGAALGRITVEKGYALTRRAPRRALNVKRTAVAKAGKPIGAGRLGLVKAKASGRTSAGTDVDHDGLPGLFDVDDDGDLVFDNVDAPPAHASAINYSGNYGAAISMLNIGLQQSRLAAQSGIAPGIGGFALNRNARNFFHTDADFMNMSSLAMRLRGSLLMLIPQEGAELDCTGFAYCTAASKTTDMTQTKRFPAEFDPDGDGFGTMQPVGAFNPANDGIATVQHVDPAKVFGMKPGVDQTQIYPGQLLVEHTRTIGDYGVLVNSVFQTVPALARWGDDVGAPANYVLDYPITDGEAGSETNPAVVRRSPSDGDYWVTLGLWKPQRGWMSDWIDIGHLTYAVAGRTIGGGSRLWQCPSSAYRIPYAQPGTEYVTADGVYDATDDAPADVNRMVSVSVDISACQRASGLPAWNDGDETAVELTVAALSDYGDAAEGVGFDFKPEPKAPAPSGDGGATPPAAPASGSWSFAGGTPGTGVNWTVHMNDAAVTKLRIQFHEATPVTTHTDPAGWACSTVTVGQPNDALECTHPIGEAAGSDVSGSVTLTNPGSNGMPVTLTVTENGTDTTLDMTQK